MKYFRLRPAQIHTSAWSVKYVPTRQKDKILNDYSLMNYLYEKLERTGRHQRW